MGTSILYLRQMLVRGGGLVDVWQMAHGPAFVHGLPWSPDDIAHTWATPKYLC